MSETSALRSTVEAVVEPLTGRTLGALGAVGEVARRRIGSDVVRVFAPVPDHPGFVALRERLEAAAPNAKVDVVAMTDDQRSEMMNRLRDSTIGPGQPGSGTRVIAVSSGKGGVGKSSVSANLAVALGRLGHTVGIIDADIWGFSIPRMLGIESPPVVIDQSIIPPVAHGVKAMSMDYFVGDEQAVIWRGPMLHKAIEQFLQDVWWDNPGFLIVDMPPGTGDVSISLSQLLPRAQVIVVTTPQATAQRVARRAAAMASKVDQEVAGVVENMSWFTGDDGTRYPIFGEGGGMELAAELGVPLMGRIPLLPAMRSGADAGVPVAVAAPDSEPAVAFDELAKAIVDRKPRVRTHPDLVIR